MKGVRDVKGAKGVKGVGRFEGSKNNCIDSLLLKRCLGALFWCRRCLSLHHVRRVQRAGKSKINQSNFCPHRLLLFLMLLVLELG